MLRPIVYDVTHLVARMSIRDPTGIDRVDLSYGRHFAGSQRSDISASHYGLRAPRVMPSATLREIVQRAEAGWREHVLIDADPTFAAVKAWLDGERVRTSGRDDQAARKRPFVG